MKIGLAEKTAKNVFQFFRVHSGRPPQSMMVRDSTTGLALTKKGAPVSRSALFSFSLID